MAPFFFRVVITLSLPPSPLTLSVPPTAVPTALPGMDLLKAELLTSGTSPIAHEFFYFGGPSPALFALPLLCPNPTSHSTTGPSGRCCLMRRIIICVIMGTSAAHDGPGFYVDQEPFRACSSPVPHHHLNVMMGSHHFQNK